MNYFDHLWLAQCLAHNFLQATRHEGHACAIYRSLDTLGNLLFIVVCFAYILVQAKNTVASNRAYPAEHTKRELSMLKVFNFMLPLLLKKSIQVVS
jgi:hypothetical protein